jgi:hypothetical protein
VVTGLTPGKICLTPREAKLAVLALPRKNWPLVREVQEQTRLREGDHRPKSDSRF